MEIRPTTEDDLPQLYEVFRVAIGELYRRHLFSPPDPSFEAHAAHQAHLLRHDAERCFTAVEDGRVVAFGAAMARGDSWFLSSLFVRPQNQGQGLGPALLDRCWGEGYATRRTLTDSFQPVSNGLYARRGLIPATPMLALAGIPRPTVAPVDLERTEPDDSALAQIDAAAYGFDRAVDHAHWARFARPTLWRRDGEPVAWSYAWEYGRIGPLGALDGPTAAAALEAELALRPAGRAIVVAPGSAGELVAAALGAGLRFSGPPGLLLLSPEAPPPRALAISGYALL